MTEAEGKVRELLGLPCVVGLWPLERHPEHAGIFCLANGYQGTIIEIRGYLEGYLVGFEQALPPAPRQPTSRPRTGADATADMFT